MTIKFAMVIYGTERKVIHEENFGTFTNICFIATNVPF